MPSQVTKTAKTSLLLAVLFMACSGLWFVTGCRQALQDPSRIVLENSLVRRVLEKENEVWRTRSFSRADGSAELQVESEEFQVLFMDGTLLKQEDYRAEGNPVIRKDGERTTIEIRYVPRGELSPQAPQSIYVRYFLGKEPYLRKTLKLEMPEESAVDRLEIENFATEQVCDLGGIGEPVFLGDSWFVGLEYPGGEANCEGGRIRLAHYPGQARKNRETGKWVIDGKTAVVGTGFQGDPLELTFRDYLETIRQPYPKNMLVNTWATKANRAASPKEFLAFFDAFQKNLDRYGVAFDSLQLDLIGFAPESLSGPRQDLFPNGYGPLSDALKARGSSLSIWLAPNGTGNLARMSNYGPDQPDSSWVFDPTAARWMAEQGYQRTNGPFQDFQGHFCVSNPKYYADLRETLRKTIGAGEVSYLKHDFVQVACWAENHAHLPTLRHGFEANLDATLNLLDYERELNPNILRAPTSYVWLSPWWLMHANYMWYGGSDTGATSSWPQLSPGEWEMNYKDGHQYKVQNQWNHKVPMNAMVTQVFWRHEATRKREVPESLREWSDFVLMACGRGLRVMDFYMEPDLSPEFWQALGESLNWWQENLDVLESTRMVGGDPRKGQVYGYAHWKEEHGILCLRNPDVGEQAIAVPFDKSVFYRGQAGRSFRGRVVYPYIEDLPSQFISGTPILLTVPGYSVMLVELEPGEALSLSPTQPEGLIEGKGSVVLQKRDWSNFYQDPSMALTATVSLSVPDEEMARCDLFLIARSNGALPHFPRMTLNGQEVTALVVEGTGDRPEEVKFPRDTETFAWSIHALDLREFQGRQVELTAVSSKNPVPFLLDAWVVADRPVRVAAAPGEKVPASFWQNFRRQTRRLLWYSLSRVPLHH